MIQKALISRCLCSCFAIAFTTSVSAQIVHVGGPLRPGEARPPLHLNLGPFSTSSTAPPYTPAQIRHAYGFDQLINAGTNGAGQVIAIVDAYGSSSVQKDLNSFCSYFGIPSTTVQIYYPQGKPPSNTGWAQETSLDVEWAHAIAPGATIVLVVAKSNSYINLLGAVDYAVSLGASVVSMSWGGNEFSGETSYDFHFNKAGVTFVASSGDNGEAVEWPAASPYVVSVGGTSLSLDASGNYASETAWSGSGGGISTLEGLPSYQSGWGAWGATRGVPDVSYLADPNTGVYVVFRGGLYAFGGTSVGAPQWSALVALSNQMRNSAGLGLLSSSDAAIYSVAAIGSAGTPYNINPNYLFDIKSGSNGTDGDDFAALSYDLVTGLGSPKANSLVPILAESLATTTSIYAPAVTYPGPATVTVTVMATGWTPSGNVTLSVGGAASVQPLNNGSAIFQVQNLGAGTYSLAAQYSPPGNPAFSSVTGSLTVTPAALTITADDQTMAYGAAMPTLTASYSGFVNGDTAASLTTPVTLATTAMTGSGVGTYPIIASGAVGANYAISYANGTLTVTPAATTTTITAPSTAMDDVAYTVTVTVSSSGGTPTGTVTLSSNDGSSPQVVAVGGNDVVTFSVTDAAGTYTLTATYSGDTNFTGSSASATVTVQ